MRHLALHCNALRVGELQVESLRGQNGKDLGQGHRALSGEIEIF